MTMCPPESALFTAPVPEGPPFPRGEHSWSARPFFCLAVAYAHRLNSTGSHSRLALAGCEIPLALLICRLRRMSGTRKPGTAWCVRPQGCGHWGCGLGKFLFGFDGRLSRQPYWLALLAVLLVDSTTFGIIGGFELFDGDTLTVERKGPSRL